MWMMAGANSFRFMDDLIESLSKLSRYSIFQIPTYMG